MAVISPNVPEEIAKLMREYKLSDEEHFSALQKIREYCFKNKRPNDKPIAWLIIAQTGGGKSNLTAEILRNNPNTVVIDSDAFKAFNPRRNEIIEKHPTIYGYLTGLDAYDHRDEIYAEALKNKYNILIEIAPSMKEKLFNVNFEELRANGYTVNAAILAVSKINSLLSIHERYEGQIEGGMASPKLTDLKRHEDSFNAVMPILEELENSQYVTETFVYGRSSIKDNVSVRATTIMSAPVLVSDKKATMIESFGRTRELDMKKELPNIEKRIKNIEETMERRNAPVPQREQFAKVKEIVTEIIREIQK